MAFHKPAGCRARVGLYIISSVAMIRDAIVSISLAIKEDIHMVRISVLAPVLFMTGCVSTGSLANSPVVINPSRSARAPGTLDRNESGEL